MFFNKKTVYGGITSDSKREADYAQELNLMRSAQNPRDRVDSWNDKSDFHSL
jgi:hypothetical protein